MLEPKYFKTELAYKRQQFLNPKMQEIMKYAIYYLTSRGHFVAYYVTETVTTSKEDKLLNRASDTHRTCRAIDMATAGMKIELINDLIDALNSKYGALGAVSQGKPRLVVYHNSGHGWHFHIQLNRTFALPSII
jgi:hypothetical protein